LLIVASPLLFALLFPSFFPTALVLAAGAKGWALLVVMVLDLVLAGGAECWVEMVVIDKCLE